MGRGGAVADILSTLCAQSRGWPPWGQRGPRKRPPREPSRGHDGIAQMARYGNANSFEWEDRWVGGSGRTPIFFFFP